MHPDLIDQHLEGNDISFQFISEDIFGISYLAAFSVTIIQKQDLPYHRSFKIQLYEVS